MYRVNDLFYTLQGEGTHTGRPAVFLRFAGCNLWTGREADRATAACRFCDTDFADVKTTYTDAARLADAVAALWPDSGRRMVVITGGEPTLQLDKHLLLLLRARGFFIALETNGTRRVPDGVDWVCVSPKAGTYIRQRHADELKLVYPQPHLDPDVATELVTARSQRLQPMDGPNYEANLAAAVDYCLTHPAWSLSLQTHKVIGIA